MQHRFEEGDEVVHKSANSNRMVVLGYTDDGKVICRWKMKGAFQQDEFSEAELEKWVRPKATTAWLGTKR